MNKFVVAVPTVVSQTNVAVVKKLGLVRKITIEKRSMTRRKLVPRICMVMIDKVCCMNFCHLGYMNVAKTVLAIRQNAPKEFPKRV